MELDMVAPGVELRFNLLFNMIFSELPLSAISKNILYDLYRLRGDISIIRFVVDIT